MYSRLVSHELSSVQRPLRNLPITEKKRDILVSFGIVNNINLEDFSSWENEKEMESPSGQIQNKMQRHHFTSNQNNIAFLNGNNTSQVVNENEELSTLQAQLQYYQNLLENQTNRYHDLAKMYENHQNSQKNVNVKPIFKQEIAKCQLKISELEEELKEWKVKCEEQAKEHTNEVSELKVLMKTSQISGNSTQNLAVESHNKLTEQAELSAMSNRLDVLLTENSKINTLIQQILIEINSITRNNPILKQRLDYYRKNLAAVEESFDNNEKKLQNALVDAENQLNIVKFGQNGIFDSVVLNTSSLVAVPEKKAEFLESENRKLETEIKNWKVQLWNLEKKVKKQELETSPDLKYTEIDLKEIINKVNCDHFHAKNELINKVNVLENEINKLSRIKGENQRGFSKGLTNNATKINQYAAVHTAENEINKFQRLISNKTPNINVAERENNKLSGITDENKRGLSKEIPTSVNKLYQNSNSEKKDRGITKVTGLNTSLKNHKFGKVAESERKYVKNSLFYNTLNYEQQVNIVNFGRKDGGTHNGKNSNELSYTDKILRKMKK